MSKKYTIKYLCIIFIGLFIVFLTGCVENISTNKVGVLVTIVPQVEIVEFIGGENIDITVMVPVGESPHSFEPTPEQMRKVAQASAYFIVGSGVEFELNHIETILEQNPVIKVFDCSEKIDVVSFDQHYGINDHREDSEEHDHDDGGTDPHIWTSPVLIKKIAETIYNGLIEIDSNNQDEYYSNYQTYIQKMDNLHSNISTILKPYENKSFMIYHPAWGYFGDTYNLKMIAIEDEGKQPGPVGIAAIIDQAQNENITIIFVAPHFDISSAQTIADEIGGNVVFANPLMTDYESTILQLAKDIVSGSEGI